MTRSPVLPVRMVLVFSANYAAIMSEVPEQSLSFHPTTTSSCSASGGGARRDSSRRCSRISLMASRRLSRHSSRVAPSLAVGAWDFGAIGDAPEAVLLDDGCQLVAHDCTLASEDWRSLTPIRERPVNGLTAHQSCPARAPCCISETTLSESVPMGCTANGSPNEMTPEARTATGIGFGCWVRNCAQ